MACFDYNSSTATAASQLGSGRDAFEPGAAKAREDRTKRKPHITRDSVHIDPEHVWGDEGPVNE
jgi:hypothetical protein